MSAIHFRRSKEQGMREGTSKHEEKKEKHVQVSPKVLKHVQVSPKATKVLIVSYCLINHFQNKRVPFPLRQVSGSTVARLSMVKWWHGGVNEAIEGNPGLLSP